MILLVAPACGARWDDDQTEVVEARDSLTLALLRIANDGGFSGSGRNGAPVGTDEGSEDGSTNGASGDNASATTVASGNDTGGDDAANPGGRGGTPGAQPCTAPSDATGVTDSTIRVGTITTLSGPIPGFGETSLGAVRAYVAYLNSNGGVCGRQVELVSADDGQDNGRYRSILQEQEGQVFAIAGGLAGGDAGGHEVATQTGIPIVNSPVDFNYYSVPTVFGINPPYENPNAPIGKYEWLVSEGITKASLVYPAVDQTRAEVNNKHRPQMEAAGMEIVDVQELPLSTLNYDAAASRVNSSGAQYMLFVGEQGQNTGMARSLARYDIEYPDYLTGYGPEFIELAGDGAEGSTAWIRSLPTEEAGSNAEQSRFLEWMGRAAPGLAVDQFAADGWVSAKLVFDTLQNLPGPISREAFAEALRATRSYNAGGFMGEINIGQKFSNGCFIGMQVVGGKWQRIAPNSGFLC